VLDERASGVLGAEQLLVDELLGVVLSEEGGEGGGGDVFGGEAEDVLDFSRRHALLPRASPARLAPAGQLASLTLTEGGCDGSFEEQETRGSRRNPAGHCNNLRNSELELKF